MTDFNDDSIHRQLLRELGMMLGDHQWWLVRFDATGFHVGMRFTRAWDLGAHDAALREQLRLANVDQCNTEAFLATMTQERNSLRDEKVRWMANRDVELAQLKGQLAEAQARLATARAETWEEVGKDLGYKLFEFNEPQRLSLLAYCRAQATLHREPRTEE